jgi:hypothetical protein
MRVFRAFYSVVRQMPGYNSQRWSTSRTSRIGFIFFIVMYLPNCFIVMYVPFSVFCVLFVCMCILYCCHRVYTQLQLYYIYIYTHTHTYISEVQLYPFVTSALEGGVWSASRPGRFTPGKDPVPIVQEAGWAPGPVWTCAKNLAPTGIGSPDRPARNQSL